jgi:hypothetical protein
MLTNFGIYNLLLKSPLNPFSSRIKRFIPLGKISAVSVARFSQEFTLHVPDEYDYRYNC